MDTALQILNSEGGFKRRYLMLDEAYEHFHFVPNDEKFCVYPVSQVCGSICRRREITCVVNINDNEFPNIGKISDFTKKSVQYWSEHQFAKR